MSSHSVRRSLAQSSADIATTITSARYLPVDVRVPEDRVHPEVGVEFVRPDHLVVPEQARGSKYSTEPDQHERDSLDGNNPQHVAPAASDPTSRRAAAHRRAKTARRRSTRSAAIWRNRASTASAAHRERRQRPGPSGSQRGGSCHGGAASGRCGRRHGAVLDTPPPPCHPRRESPVAHARQAAINTPPAITRYSGTRRFAVSPPACSGIRNGSAKTIARGRVIGQRRKSAARIASRRQARDVQGNDTRRVVTQVDDLRRVPLVAEDQDREEDQRQQHRRRSECGPPAAGSKRLPRPLRSARPLAATINSRPHSLVAP